MKSKIACIDLEEESIYFHCRDDDGGDDARRSDCSLSSCKSHISDAWEVHTASQSRNRYMSRPMALDYYVDNLTRMRSDCCFRKSIRHQIRSQCT